MTNSELFDRLWGESCIHPFGNPAQFEQFMIRLLLDNRKMIRVDKERKEIWIPDCISLHDLAIFLMDYPEGEYKILIHEFDENTDFER